MLYICSVLGSSWSVLECTAQVAPSSGPARTWESMRSVASKTKWHIFVHLRAQLSTQASAGEPAAEDEVVEG